MRISDWSSDVCSSDLVDLAGDRGGRRGDREFAQYAADPVGVRRDPRLCLGKPRRRTIMGREAEREAFGAVEPRAGQREKDADATFEPRQIPRAPDVGERKRGVTGKSV